MELDDRIDAAEEPSLVLYHREDLGAMSGAGCLTSILYDCLTSRLAKSSTVLRIAEA
jgi:hypothetical protein